MKYRVHQLHINLKKDHDKLQNFLNELEGEVISIIPNVTPLPATHVNFLLIVEKK